MELRPGIKSRIFGAYVLVLALGAVLAFLVYTAGEHVADTSHGLTEKDVPALRAINALKLDLLTQESVLYRYYVNLDRQRFLADYERIDNVCASGFVNLAEALGQHSLLQSVQDEYRRLNRIATELDQALKTKPRNMTRAGKLLSEASEVVARINRVLDGLAGDIAARVQQSGERAKVTVRTMQNRVLLFAGAIFVISLLVGYYINAYINGQAERRRLALFPERNPNPVLQLSPAGAVLYANPGAAELLGKIGATDPRALLPRDIGQRLLTLRELPASHGSWEYGVRGGRTLECGVHWLPDLEIFHAYVTDVTERKRAQERLIPQAHHAPLTPLPNRLMFAEEFERQVYARDRAGKRAAFLLLGVDRFRVVIESVGHAIGDVLLQAVALRLDELLQRLRERLHDATLYRMDGDRFAILVPGFATAETPVWLAGQILEDMGQPFHALGREYHLSLGIR